MEVEYSHQSTITDLSFTTNSSTMEFEYSYPPTGTHTNLLSLPDDVLYTIFEALGESWFNEGEFVPSHAFPLAITNTRLFKLFRTLLKTVAPDKEPYDDATHEYTHLLAITRLAGEHLRHLDLPYDCSQILSEVAKNCPNLESVAMFEDDGLEADGLIDVLKLSIRKLWIEGASWFSLSLIHSAPEELILTEMNESSFGDLIRILKDPPRKLHLTFEVEHRFLVFFIEVVEAIKQACPKMESLIVHVYAGKDTCSDVFNSPMEVVTRHINAVRATNSEMSLCKTVKLTGNVTLPILENVHPEAWISISNTHLEFQADEDGIHLRHLL